MLQLSSVTLRTIGKIALLVYFVAAILFLGIRYWVLPNINDWRPQIERRLSHALQVEVRLGNIQAEWKGLNPRLSVQDVRFTNPQGRALLVVPDARATLSWRSLFTGAPQFAALEARGVDLSVRRDRKRQFWIMGRLLNTDTPQKPGNHAGRVLEWLLGQQSIVLRESTVRWSDASRDAPQLVLNDVTLRLVNQLTDHRFMLLASLPPGLGGALDIRGEFIHGPLASGEPLSLERGRGQLYAHVSKIKSQGWTPWMDMPPDLQSGEVSARAWLKFESGHMTTLTSDVAIKRGHWVTNDGNAFRAESLRLFLSGPWQDYGRITKQNGDPPLAGLQPSSGGLDYRLLGHDVQAYAPDVFKYALTAQSIASRGTVRHSEAGWDIGVGHLDFISDALDADLQGSWRQGGAGAAGLIDLQGTIRRASVPAISRYLPSMVDQDARDWMAKGLAAGRISDASLTLRGDLEYFPFAEQPEQGEFRLAGRYDDTVIDYLPPEDDDLGWPALTDMHGTVVLDRADLQMEAEHALMWPTSEQSIQLSSLRARIPNIEHNAVLSVSGDTVANSSAYLSLMNHTPLGEMLDGVFNKAKADGIWQVPLSLTIPLLHSRDTTVKGAVHFSGSTLRLAPGVPIFEGMTGTLDFTDTVMSISALKGRFLGGAVSLKGGIGNKLPGLTIHGQATSSALADYVKLRGMRRLEGHVDYRGRLRRSQNGTLLLDVDSDLRGLALDFPPPVSKSASQALPLAVRWRPHAEGGGMVLDVRLGKQLHGIFLHKAGAHDGPYFQSGAVGLNQEAVLPSKGLNLDLSYPSIDLDAWDAVIDDFSEAPTGGDKAPGRPLISGLSQLRLQAEQLSVQGMTLDELTFTARQPETHQWRVDISSSQTAGTLFWREAKGKVAGRVDAHFDRLALGAEDDDDQAPDDSFQFEDELDIPGINLQVKHFRLYGRNVGELSLVGVNQSRGHLWRLEQLKLSSPYAVLSGSGLWQLRGADRGLTLDAEANIQDLGQYLDQIGMNDVMKQGEGTVRGKLTWRNMPWDFSRADLNGHIEFDLRKGRFSAVNSHSARLLELLSLQSVKRLARLDFNPGGLTKEGFPYDNLRGNVSIKNGLLSTNDYRVIGPVGTIVIGGSANLVSEALDLEAVVVPNLDVSGAAIAAGIAINPIVGVGAFLTQWLLQAPLAKAMTAEYSIGGTWTEPHITEMSRPNADRGADGAVKPPQPPRVEH